MKKSRYTLMLKEKSRMSEWSSLRRSCALQIVLIVFFLSATTTKAQVLEQDSLALVALYNATNGDQWNDHTNWLQGLVSTWYGIDIEGNRVDTVSLSNNGLTGTIPGAIGSLTSLKALYLENSGLSGPLPTSIENLVELRRFNISGSNIRGRLPAQLGKLANLETLSISGTKFSGLIPGEIGNLHSLEFLLLISNDSLEGPIPESILRLPKLRLLLSLNSRLAGSTLTAAIKNAVDLEQLWIINSGFEGAIPDELVALNKVENINLDGNGFNKVPDLTAMSSLSIVTIQNNLFTFEDIEPNLALRDQGKTFVYTPQKPVYHTQTITARAGSRLVLKSEVGGSANSYQWFKNVQPIGGLTSSLELNTISLADIGNYTARITSAIVTDLTLQRNPVQLQVVKDTIYTSCDEAPITLNAEVSDPLATYLWSNGQTTPAITVNASGKYGIRIETPDYILVDTLETFIPSKLSLGPDIDTCEPSVPVSSNIVNADGYEWQTPTGTITDQSTLTATVDGRYILEVSKGTCILKDTVEVTLNRFTTGSFTATAGSAELDDSGMVLSNVALTFRNTTGTGNTFAWSFDENASIEEEPTYTFTRAGQYAVILSGVDSRNCPITVEQTITVTDLVITNAISPNGDGKNDRLFVEPFLYTAELKVINRWGQPVYETSSYANDFTGTNLESGVYYYELYFKDIDKRFKGYVHVMKGN
jgi:Leucine-rich repeat (LRR) protein